MFQTQRAGSCWCLHTHFLMVKVSQPPHLGAGAIAMTLIQSLTWWRGDKVAGQVPTEGSHRRGASAQGPGPLQRGGELSTGGAWCWGRRCAGRWGGEECAGGGVVCRGCRGGDLRDRGCEAELPSLESREQL